MTSTETTPTPAPRFTPLKKVAIIACAVAGLLIAGTVAFAVASNNEDVDQDAAE